jgi:predicted homoserine dehydrogenase-like protein
LALQAKQIGQPISDYLLCSTEAQKRFPAGVFITAEYDKREASTLEYLKLGAGPYYTLLQNYHLIYLDIPRTIRQVLQEKTVLLNNSTHPTASVCAIAKKELRPGTLIRREDRNFMVRGEAINIRNAPNHIPIGLLYDVVIKRKIDTGQMLEFDDVEIQPTEALTAWQFTLNRIN